MLALTHKGHPRNKRETAYELGLLIDFWRMAWVLPSALWLQSCLAWEHCDLLQTGISWARNPLCQKDLLLGQERKGGGEEWGGGDFSIRIQGSFNECKIVANGI